MAFGGPSITCPRCNSVQAAQAQFCNTCGLYFAAAQPPGSVGSPPPLTTFQFPGAPQGYPGPPTAPAPAAPVSARTGRGKLVLILVVVAVVLVGGGIGGFLLLRHPSTTSNNPAGASVDRHGLETNVPLPNNITFVLKDSPSRKIQAPAPVGTVSLSVNRWLWVVAGSTPTAVQQFYTQNLPGSGWSKLVPSSNGSDKGVTACQGTKQALFIDVATKVTPPGKAPISAPAGGSLLSISIADNQSSPELVQLTCSGLPSVPVP